jgi:aminoglycoside phosphotransferase (APT) family kinase protein
VPEERLGQRPRDQARHQQRSSQAGTPPHRSGLFAPGPLRSCDNARDRARTPAIDSPTAESDRARHWMVGCAIVTGASVDAARVLPRRATGRGGNTKHMALTKRRDDSAIAAGLTRWLTQREGLGDLIITGFHRPSAGYSSETMIVDASWRTDGVVRHKSLVVRMAPASNGTFPHYDLVAQWQAQTAAATAGVAVADPTVETETRWLGSPFMVMRRVEGHIIGALPHRDRWLCDHDESDQHRIYCDFITTMSNIHRSDTNAAPDVPRRDNAAELDFWDDYLAWSSNGSPVPVLVDALDWCRRRQPATEPEPALLWGDARFENMVFGDDLGVQAVLDWDMTSIGAPEHDLAWFTSLDLTTNRIFGERLSGFPDRAETIALFEQGSGRPVQHLEWYETLAMVRSTAVMTRIGYLRRDAGEPLLLPIEDNPILDLVRSRLT